MDFDKFWSSTLTKSQTVEEITLHFQSLALDDFWFSLALNQLVPIVVDETRKVGSKPLPLRTLLTRQHDAGISQASGYLYFNPTLPHVSFQPQSF